MNQTGSTGLSTSDEQERQLATLLRNELIAGDPEAAKLVMASARSATFSKGDRIIAHGVFDDSVYFILSGSVEVQINKRHIDFRSAPHTVGEMGAKKAGELRTADVIVNSKTLEAMVLSGTEFRKLMRDFPNFSRNLDDFIDALSRKKIMQLGEARKTGGLSWTAISGITGLVFAVCIAVIGWIAELSFLQVGLSSVLVGILGFICILLLNPEHRYRNLASAAGYAVIVLITYGSISFALTIDGKDLHLPLIDFSVHTEGKLGGLAVGAAALLLLTWLGGIFDLKLGKSNEE